MKKLLALCCAFLLILCMAGCEVPDLSQLSEEELAQLEKLMTTVIADNSVSEMDDLSLSEAEQTALIKAAEKEGYQVVFQDNGSCEVSSKEHTVYYGIHGWPDAPVAKMLPQISFGSIDAYCYDNNAFFISINSCTAEDARSYTESIKFRTLFTENIQLLESIAEEGEETASDTFTYTSNDITKDYQLTISYADENLLITLESMKLDTSAKTPYLFMKEYYKTKVSNTKSADTDENLPDEEETELTYQQKKELLKNLNFKEDWEKRTDHGEQILAAYPIVTDLSLFPSHTDETLLNLLYDIACGKEGIFTENSFSSEQLSYLTSSLRALGCIITFENGGAYSVESVETDYFALGEAYPENIYTASIPMPQCGNLFSASEDGGEFSVMVYNASLTDVRIYAKTLKLCGFDSELSEANTSAFGFDVYTFSGTNEELGCEASMAFSYGVFSLFYNGLTEIKQPESK